MMKRSIRIFALAMAILMLAMTFAGCGKKLSGKYSADVLGTGTTMTFDGSDVKIGITVTLLGEVASLDATYKIKDDKISFDIANEEEITNDLAKKVIRSLEEPVDFLEGEDYININGVKYEKVAD